MGIVLLILLSPLWLALPFVGLTFALAAWVFPGTSGGSRARPAAQALGLFACVLMEWLATAWVMVAFPWRGFRYAIPAAGAGRRTALVVIPGLCENALTLSILARRLSRRTGAPVLVITPRRYFDSLENLAAACRQQIEAFLRETGCTRADLVGHSMGGILARLLSQPAQLGERVRSIVTVASPHLGSALSAVGIGRNLRQMRRGSAFLESLNAQPPPESVRIAGICSIHDNLVLPWNCALSPHGENLLLRFRAHLTLILSAEVADRVAERLAAPRRTLAPPKL
ncbi:MAG: alpha/beta fold hydrolase [Myxococcales bacterium]|nr:alpha/beta fold hydrolase [Myxococcales bacterium]